MTAAISTYSTTTTRTLLVPVLIRSLGSCTYLQMFSTAVSCAVSTGPLLEKSKRSLQQYITRTHRQTRFMNTVVDALSHAACQALDHSSC